MLAKSEDELKSELSMLRAGRKDRIRHIAKWVTSNKFTVVEKEQLIQDDLDMVKYYTNKITFIAQILGIELEEVNGVDG